MPSLPPDSKTIDSKESAYDRYFGRLKEFSPQRPRWELCKVIIYICVLCTIFSSVDYVILRLYYNVHQRNTIYIKNKLYYFAVLYQSMITFIWCWSIITMIYHNKYTKSITLVIIAFIVNMILSMTVLSYLSHLFYEKDQHYQVFDDGKEIWDVESWNVYFMYWYIFSFPLVLYFSVLSTHCLHFVICANIKQKMIAKYSSMPANMSDHLIDVISYPDHDETPEVFERASNASTAFSTPTKRSMDSEYGHEIELSLPSKKLYPEHRFNNVTITDFEIASRGLVTTNVLIYSIVLMMILFIWFVISTFKKKYFAFHIIRYFALFAFYNFGKYILKRFARRIDATMAVPKFSFEIVTEIMMSGLYWMNLRMFPLRYASEYEYLSFWFICIIHFGNEFFQSFIRFTSGYFNAQFSHKQTSFIFCHCYTHSEMNSNMRQWKVRGAVDTCIRFIVCVYSMVFFSIRYVSKGYYHQMHENGEVHSTSDMDDKEQALLFNGCVFIIEVVYFCIIIFVPRVIGRISDDKQINIAEPLMRIYNRDSKLFLTVCCGSIVVSSLLVL